jgi:hypothetical protein
MVAYHVIPCGFFFFKYPSRRSPPETGTEEAAAAAAADGLALSGCDGSAPDRPAGGTPSGMALLASSTSPNIGRQPPAPSAFFCVAFFGDAFGSFAFLAPAETPDDVELSESDELQLDRMLRARDSTDCAQLVQRKSGIPSASEVQPLDPLEEHDEVEPRALRPSNCHDENDSVRPTACASTSIALLAVAQQTRRQRLLPLYQTDATGGPHRTYSIPIPLPHARTHAHTAHTRNVRGPLGGCPATCITAG